MVTVSAQSRRPVEQEPEEEERRGGEHGGEDDHPPAGAVADVAAGEAEGDPEERAADAPGRAPGCARSITSSRGLRPKPEEAGGDPTQAAPMTM